MITKFRTFLVAEDFPELDIFRMEMAGLQGFTARGLATCIEC